MEIGERHGSTHWIQATHGGTRRSSFLVPSLQRLAGASDTIDASDAASPDGSPPDAPMTDGAQPGADGMDATTLDGGGAPGDDGGSLDADASRTDADASEGDADRDADAGLEKDASVNAAGERDADAQAQSDADAEAERDADADAAVDDAEAGLDAASDADAEADADGGDAGPDILGSAKSFAVLAGSTVTIGPVPPSTETFITGDVGTSPNATAIGVFSAGQPNGQIHAGDAVSLQAEKDLTTAYNTLFAMPCGTALTGQDFSAHSACLWLPASTATSVRRRSSRGRSRSTRRTTPAPSGSSRLAAR